MERFPDLSGKYRVRLSCGEVCEAVLPGTLDENMIGGPDIPLEQWNGGAGAGGDIDESFGPYPINTRFTRNHTYEGKAEFARTVTLDAPLKDARYLIYVERSRELSLTVNGKKAERLTGSLSAPYLFETEALRDGENELVFISDNSYEGLPAGAIKYSSAATDETQTNWNGLLGEISLIKKPMAFILSVMPAVSRDMKTLDVTVVISPKKDSHLKGAKALLTLASVAFGKTAVKEAVLEEDITRVHIKGIELKKDAGKWDLGEPVIHMLTVSLKAEDTEDTYETSFGIRAIGEDKDHRITLNGRRIFIRSEANCAAFPETGHAPMDISSWLKIMDTYMSYGVNCVRFHSHCPPPAAFKAADMRGILMQPELSNWDPKDAFGTEEAYSYYKREMEDILAQYACHPSFVMMTLGNELFAGEEGLKRMSSLINMGKDMLPDRMYAWGSNVFYGEKGCDADSDFYTSQSYKEHQMRAISAAQDPEHPDRKAKIRGYLNNSYPDSVTDYMSGMEAFRKDSDKPMFSFEVGQYEVLPDFHELEKFRGVTRPVNYEIIKKRAEKRGILDIWDRMVEATGEISLMGYKEEAEAVMRTPLMSGISFLSLQDFPGQGTAIVGMMDSHLEPKPFPFARPERFKSFFRDSLPMIKLPRFTYRAGEDMEMTVFAVNYGKKDIKGDLRIRVYGSAYGEIWFESLIRDADIKAGTAHDIRKITVVLPDIKEAEKLDISVALKGSEESFRNTVSVWVYPEKKEDTEGISIFKSLTDEALSVLEAGGKVLLEPVSDKEHMPGGIRGQFTTDFWSVGTFPQQEGGMGLLIDDTHPVFRDFPTSFYTERQWWLMAGQCAMRLKDESMRKGIIVRQMDSYAELRTMAMLFEARVGKGRLMISSMGLDTLPDRPEVTALRNSMIRYMKSPDFEPGLKVTPEDIRKMII